MKFIDSNTIRLDRILSELDKFVIKFIRILEKHSDYVIVSGYVAILFGRSRTTEDVDIIIPVMEKKKFIELYRELLSSGFWALNSSTADDLFDLLSSNIAIRIAEDGEVEPNIEIKFAKSNVDRESLNKKIRIMIGECSLYTSPLELQIAYKERILGSEKDMEDARHLRVVFEKDLNKDLLDYCMKNVRLD